MANVVSEVGMVIPAGVPEESSKSGTSWGAVIAGGVAAAVATLVLMLVGSGLGLTMMSPFSNEGVSLESATVWTAIWLVVVQWLSAGLGGYMAGRLARTKWVNLHTDEVFFRDTAHGFLAWAVATLLVAALLGSTISAIIGGGVHAASTVAGGAAMGGAAAATSSASSTSADAATSYFVDTLLRPADPTRPAEDGGDQTAAQASRILVASALAGEMVPEDRAYLEQLVAARAGLSPEDAKARVDAVLQRVNAAAGQAKEAADKARKAGATFALVGALSLVLGAFIASASAALAGRLRDENEGAVIVRS